MSEQPTSGQAAETTRAVYTGDQPNPILHFLQRPRIMLLCLAGWSILSMLAQVFTSSGLFLDAHNIELDGALGGFALGFEGIPLAAVYIYAIKDPLQHRPVFILALIHMAAMAASQVYHLGTGDFSFESVAIPLFGSAGLGALVFLHLFSPREHEGVAAKAG
jgi:hypothetical protein